jgi:hypothetical protein
MISCKDWTLLYLICGIDTPPTEEGNAAMQTSRQSSEPAIQERSYVLNVDIADCNAQKLLFDVSSCHRGKVQGPRIDHFVRRKRLIGKAVIKEDGHLQYAHINRSNDVYQHQVYNRERFDVDSSLPSTVSLVAPVALTPLGDMQVSRNSGVKTMSSLQ